MVVGQHIFLGSGAQLAVMGELTARGYVVATPSVDIGDDLLVARGNGAFSYRVQVRGRMPTRCRRLKAHYASYIVKSQQLQRAWSPELYYVFALRIGSNWEHVVISRKELLALFRKLGRKLTHPRSLTLAFSFHENHVFGLRQEMQQYRNNWSRYWPDLVHPPALPQRPDQTGRLGSARVS